MAEVAKANVDAIGAGNRLYQDIARKLTERISDGTYPVGRRIPAEREISAEFNVSRPTVREAIIALEVQGLIEVRIGSGAYVRSNVSSFDSPGFGVTAFEVAEARLLFEGEAAALAAANITDAELAELVTIVEKIQSRADASSAEEADKDFHLAIAHATRNPAIYSTIEGLWQMRQSSPESALLHKLARTAKVRPVVEEHIAIIDAIRTRDPGSARAAMRAHLGAVIEHLLFATEEEAIEKAKNVARDTRARYAKALSI